MSRLSFLLVLISLALCGGCTGSRWARADPKYRRKYDHHTEEPARVIKQAIDARHVAGRGGVYLSGGGGEEPANAEAAVGFFNYPEPLGGAVEAYAGLRGTLVDQVDGGVAGGGELGVRLQAPSRLAPFVGVSGFVGPTPFEEEPDGRSPLFDEEDARNRWAASVSPEAGLHFWLTPKWRLSASVKHTLLGVEGGGSADYTTVGLTLGFLQVPDYGEYRGPVTDFGCAETIPATPSDPGLPPIPVTVGSTGENPYLQLIPPGTIRPLPPPPLDLDTSKPL